MLTNIARSAGALLALAAAPVTAGVAGATGAAVVHTVAAEPSEAPVPPSEDVQLDDRGSGREGKTRNHGDFVREQREAGLRGRDLAGAIHEEKGNSPPGHAKASPTERRQEPKGERERGTRERGEKERGEGGGKARRQ
ncbi:MAG: hypothetical protein H0V89_07605 [Deltaproteobacteria bacterium]|nr:hypothetical protein [Deltaproteobacteria bacterium]